MHLKASSTTGGLPGILGLNLGFSILSKKVNLACEQLFQVGVYLLIKRSKRLAGLRNDLVQPSILNLTFPPHVPWAGPSIFFPQTIALSLHAKLREALADEKNILSTKGEPEGAGLAWSSRWWSQWAVTWDGQSLVPASYLLHAQWLSRGYL